ncbi:MAG: binding domain protein [Thermotogaceae bacterium]|jgi:S1 RNA binding domain protein|nr:binding domain protein [Thermotogaceae bacterium]MDN5338851.1 binding domain protein [Thermotogaceae bacterium]
MSVQVGDTLKGKVVGITKFGAFVDLENGEKGLIHISKISRNYVKNISDYLHVGQEVEVKVIGKGKDGKLDLSMKDIPQPQQEGSDSKAESSNASNSNRYERENKNEDSFEKRLAKFMRDSERKFSDYKKTREKKKRR